MARSIGEEEIQLKKRARRRLVGAIVLVSAVAVILPMVLDKEPRQSNQNVDIQIPSPETAPAYSPNVAPPASKTDPAPVTKDTVPAPKDGASAPPVSKVDVPTQAASPAAPATEEKKTRAEKLDAAQTPVAKTTASTKSGDTAKAAAIDVPKAVPSGKFVVQIAALADSAKAKALQQRVAHGGVKSYTEVVKTSKGKVTRVRAGPYATREAAEKARLHLKQAGLDGKVVPK